MDAEASASIAATAIVATEAAAAARAMPAMRIADSNPVEPMPPVSSLADMLNLCSQRVWGIDLRPLQLAALSKLFGDCRDLRKLLVVQKTGGGKTHIIRVMGSMMKGIHVVLHPLLALTGDQVIRFQEGSDAYGAVDAINLDERGKNTKWRKKFIARISAMSNTTTSTVFIFTSPQFLADNKKDVRDTLINVCLNKRTFRSFTVDEVHLYSQHGSSFRSELRLVGEEFLKPVFGGEQARGRFRPFFLALSATVSLTDLTTFGALTGVGFPHKYRMWGDFHHFAMPNCHLGIRIGSEYTRSLDIIRRHLQNNDSAAFAFTNGRALSFHLVSGLEGKLDSHGIAADVVHIHGKLRLEDKMNFSKLYCRKIHVPDYDPRVLVATSAADLGIDHPNAQCGLNNEWPASISTFVQRRGRASRRDEDALIVVIAGVASYLHLFKRIKSDTDLANDDGDDDKGKKTSGYTNLLITPKKGKTVKQRHRDQRYKLNRTQRDNLVKRQLADLRDVLDLFCLDRGCIQRRIQMYLAKGSLVDYPLVMSPCGNCAHCRRFEKEGWGHYFLPLRRDGIITMLTHGDVIPCNASYESLMSVVWNSDKTKREHWMKAIFDKPMNDVCKYNVEAMFLQLLAAGLIAIDERGGLFKFVLARGTSSVRAFPPFRYEYEGNWKGILLATGTRKYNVI